MKELSVYPVIYDQKVAWGDMDAFGHVNNVQYYRYIESSRILYMENVNILTPNIYTVVASSQCKYLKPVFYPDVLKVGVRVEELRKSAFRMAYILWSESQQQIVATGALLHKPISKGLFHNIIFK
ncbi:thioesterase superfamily protein [Acinetobacter baumannii 1397084]|nr:thioesterase superfamily protein [Acinetobacter baumannii 1397084]EXB19817.1 thioesterase superfamily protein [Acinetobacter baumannii 1406750]EXB58554.1 thioesterase superfamily protein [Acinetobacter baumannii 1465485]EXD10783.1 thioesterase superfamily protein [Acinetobacter baumannii 1289546]EXG75419.1 thioesterase superfamily protein [Acinetobacter baumannii 1296252]EXG94705.1 thioesterase superfamily protein [Acinetobacter baumannii 1022959]EXR25998.1 thioesterase superfamily protein